MDLVVLLFGLFVWLGLCFLSVLLWAGCILHFLIGFFLIVVWFRLDPLSVLVLFLLVFWCFVFLVYFLGCVWRVGSFFVSG